MDESGFIENNRCFQEHNAHFLYDNISSIEKQRENKKIDMHEKTDTKEDAINEIVELMKKLSCKDIRTIHSFVKTFAK